MRVIPTHIHGYIDYVIGIVLIAAPWLLGFAAGGAETWVPVVIGASVIVYSLVTDYELGIMPGISMDTHLLLDGIGGLVLALSPWIFGFAELVWIPHLVVGILEVLTASMTERVPATGPRARRRATGGRPSP